MRLQIKHTEKEYHTLTTYADLVLYRSWSSTCTSRIQFPSRIYPVTQYYRTYQMLLRGSFRFVSTAGFSISDSHPDP